MMAGQRVRWYLRAWAARSTCTPPHWHGNTVVVAGMRTDVSNLLPATMQVADMVGDDCGSWLFHCHINDHILAGMQARYQVPGTSQPSPAGTGGAARCRYGLEGESALRVIDSTACPRSCADCFAGSGRN